MNLLIWRRTTPDAVVEQHDAEAAKRLSKVAERGRIEQSLYPVADKMNAGPRVRRRFWKPSESTASTS